MSDSYSEDARVTSNFQIDFGHNDRFRSHWAPLKAVPATKCLLRADIVAKIISAFWRATLIQ